MNLLSNPSRLVVYLSANVALIVVAASSFGAEADANALIKAAAEGTGQARYTAIDDLGEHHLAGATAVPALQKLLSDKDPQVRWRSARALGDYGDQAVAAAPDLRRLLSESDPLLQYHAAVSLGRVGDKSEATVQALVTTATSKDERVARAAIASLRELQPDPTAVVKSLGEVLTSDDEAVVLHALEAIVEHGGKATPMLKAALKNPETAYLAATAIERIGPDAAGAVPELIEVIGATKHSHLLIQSLLAVASIGPPAEAAAPKIVGLLEHSTDKTVPVAAAYALGSIGAKNADAALKAAVANPNPFLQMVASWALAKVHPGDVALEKAAVTKLVAGLKSSDVAIRTAAAKGLQSLEAPPEIVAPELVQAVRDKDPQVQANVIDAIASLGETVVPRVSKALERPDGREAAVRILQKLGPKAAGAVEPLIRAANTADASFRTDIQLALGAIGPAAAPAADMLSKSLSSSDAGERESALLALRQIGPGAAAAVNALRSKAKADDSFESHAAAWALVRIAPQDKNVATDVLPKLTQGLSNANEQVRAESADALAELGTAAKAATPALQKAAQHDSSEAVRAAAAVALQRIAG